MAIPLLVGTIYYRLSDVRLEWKHLLSPLVSALFIIGAFTLARTHLSTYIMPAYPLLAIFIAIFISLYSEVLNDYKEAINYVVIPIFLIIACFCTITSTGKIVTDVHFQEREIGKAIHTNNADNIQKDVPIYALDWQQLDTIKYYSDANAVTLDAKKEGGTVLKGPLYLTTHTLAENFFYAGVGKPRPGFEGLKVVYQGDYLVLFYSENDVKLPIF
jgi:hypothetical protein